MPHFGLWLDETADAFHVENWIPELLLRRTLKTVIFGFLQEFVSDF